jgi:hypothetical protein
MKKFILIILVFIASPAFMFGQIIMTPYLQAVDTNSIYVLVECAKTDTVIVNYGLTPSYGLSAKTKIIDTTTLSTGSYIHKVKITGLTPNTFYYYRAVQDTSISLGSTFRTAVSYGTNFRFAWMADCRTGLTFHDQISHLIDSINPLFSLYGGDMCHGQTYQVWKDQFFRPNELNVISHIPFYFAAGNHEGWVQNTKAFVRNPTSASGTQDFYSFDYSFMHVLSINNQVAEDSGSAQYNFAASDLASTDKPWKVVFYHKPAYCYGGEGESGNMRKMSKYIFVPNHVDLVLTGHSHFYQRNFVSGIPHLVIGAAGGPLQDPDTSAYTVKSAKEYNFAIIDVTLTDLVVMVYNNTGGLIDSLHLHKTITGVEKNNEVVSNIVLYDNFPNPFSNTTNIKFLVAKSSDVKIVISDITGHEIKTLVNEKLKPGNYEYLFDGSSLPDGTYFYNIKAGNYSETKKMIHKK